MEVKYTEKVCSRMSWDKESKYTEKYLWILENDLFAKINDKPAKCI